MVCASVDGVAVEVDPQTLCDVDADEHFVLIGIEELLAVSGIVAPTLGGGAYGLVAVVASQDADAGAVVFPHLGINGVGMAVGGLTGEADVAFPSTGNDLSHIALKLSAGDLGGIVLENLEVKGDHSDFLLTDESAALAVAVAAVATEEGEVDVSLVEAVDHGDGVVRAAVHLVVTEGKAVVGERTAAVYANDVLAADLYSLVEAVGKDVGIVAVIIVTAVGHSKADTALGRNVGRGRADIEAVATVEKLAVGDEGKVLALCPIGATQVDASHSVAVVVEDDGKVLKAQARAVLYASFRPAAAEHVDGLAVGVGKCRIADVQDDTVVTAASEAVFVTLTDYGKLAPAVRYAHRRSRAAVAKVVKAVYIVSSVQQVEVFILLCALVDAPLNNKLVAFAGTDEVGRRFCLGGAVCSRDGYKSKCISHKALQKNSLLTQTL